MKPRRFHGLKRPLTSINTRTHNLPVSVFTSSTARSNSADTVADKRFRALQKLRQSWNKYNLYNIFKAVNPKIGLGTTQTFFQQKWRAKGMLRTYHGEHIVERKWERMFNRRLLSVIDMDTESMAKMDGSEMAAGRGSGIDQRLRPGDKRTSRTLTPYMQMTFAPMERRLDIAVFRAMFASSARQARQFCVHGAVKVNGKVVPYPAYRLNPGDMFQVDPERVLYATGLPKLPPSDSNQPSSHAGENEATEEAVEKEAEAISEEESEVLAAKAEQDPDTTDAPEAAPVNMKPTRTQIQDLTAQAKAILSEEPLSLDLGVGRDDKASSEEAAPSDPIAGLTDSELKKLEERMEEHMREEKENPHDPSKPYVTPWRPRNYMAPFAFIPQYLEVNQNICSAVYLRHPVARKGNAEVPTPYPYETSQLAFNWYLRRR
ncbi:hypothetical protein EKO27_g354 [Xylaria grammica]|uniref:RNA-binding S4 domain-containing protein n=1 Tax=Xylaria grammica TaxID=363999 RepID=A0A439DK53_9PEZI|nr:hypothetical protein EKO27_g354 [Xylaria grammica]